MANPELQTPLNGQSFSIDGIAIVELAPCTKISLRANPESLAGAVESVCGVPAVSAPNHFSTANENILYWMGPDERLVHCQNAVVADTVQSLKQALPVGKSAVVDVSDYYTVLRISGDKARDILASGTPFDVHPDVFKAGQCAQIRYGNASILLSRIADNTYELQVRWSFAQYLWKYLCKVARYV